MDKKKVRLVCEVLLDNHPEKHVFGSILDGGPKPCDICNAARELLKKTEEKPKVQICEFCGEIANHFCDW